jgi:rhodanese-related sulfurtransferase
MRDILGAYPGAQRALFRRYHIGGCSSCAFQPDETLLEVCGRNGKLNVDEVLDHIKASHEEDVRVLITSGELKTLLQRPDPPRLVDVRSREEYEATRIEGAVLLSQPVMQEMLSQWPRDTAIVVYDHRGSTGLDAAAYFLGQGFLNVRALRGGIDAWSLEAEPQIPRYRLEYAQT